MRSNLTPREAIQAAFSAIATTSTTLLKKIEDVAANVDAQGFGDRITTRQIRRQLIATGRA